MELSDAVRNPGDASRRAMAKAVRIAKARRSALRRAPADIDALPPEVFVRYAYQMILQRDPDPGGRQNYVDHLTSGRYDRLTVIDEMITSTEFALRVRLRDPLRSLHLSRCDWVRTIPRARRILDLGGTDQDSAAGSLVNMGYPYDFESLTIVELPPADRHELYRNAEVVREVGTDRGPVRYVYQSMTDLGCFDDGSLDLVVSGQSIEHITFDEADLALKQSYRVLRPGGYLALDTPNGRACRVQQAELTNPDHKYEYTHEELSAKIEAAGFAIESALGLAYVGDSIRLGEFSFAELARNRGLYHEIRDCYVLGYVARKPG